MPWLQSETEVDSSLCSYNDEQHLCLTPSRYFLDKPIKQRLDSLMAEQAVSFESYLLPLILDDCFIITRPICSFKYCLFSTTRVCKCVLSDRFQVSYLITNIAVNTGKLESENKFTVLFNKSSTGNEIIINYFTSNYFYFYLTNPITWALLSAKTRSATPSCSLIKVFAVPLNG